MRNSDRYFDVCPKIVRAGREATITIHPRFDHVRFDTAVPDIHIFPAEGGKTDTTKAQPATPTPTLTGGDLRICYHFESEQEYTLLIGDPRRPFAEFRLYALDDDLFDRRPYKGDVHMHSFRSDGRESPAYVAAACRRVGFDFMALTDHRQYTPSLEAIQAFENAPIDLRIYPGEEVHPPDNPIHIVNFGGGFSVNDLFINEADAYLDGVQAIAGALDDFPPGVDRYTYASSVWCFDKIRAGGGLAVFCHPYWRAGHRYDVPETLTTLILDRQPYDALELIGGYHPHEVESNALQVARYNDERARGKRIPIVGVSDAHGCETGELFGWYYTVVFAPSPDLPDLVQSINDLYSVAVEALPGWTPRAHGPFRLAKYAHYLLREIFPRHDDLCVDEGKLMLAYAAGDANASGATSAADILSAYQGRTAALYDHLWAND